MTPRKTRSVADTVRQLEATRAAVLAELHPELRARVQAVLTDMGGRVTPWCGFRGQIDQDRAFAEGHSNARFGESPHNFKPALAVDVVLFPALVHVRRHPDDSRYLDLWDDESPEARVAWSDLEKCAAQHHLQRVTLAGGVRDRPHLELPAWRSYIVH